MDTRLLFRASVLELLHRTPARPIVDWFLAEDWRTWLAHYLIVGLVTLTTAWWIVWIGVIVTLIYLLREGMDASKDRAKWIDHSMDWATAWGGFGTAMFLLDGNFIGAIILTIFIAALSIIAYTVKTHEV